MIYTSYFSKQRKMELPDTAYMSIAVGNPRYPVPYKIIDFKMLKPYGIFKVYHGEEYRQKYFERLDLYGVEKIREEMLKLSEGHENIVLMCHEKNKLDCHRSMFAEWWYEKTGEQIPEYGEEVEEKIEEEKKDENYQLTIFDI